MKAQLIPVGHKRMLSHIFAAVTEIIIASSHRNTCVFVFMLRMLPTLAAGMVPVRSANVIRKGT